MGAPILRTPGKMRSFCRKNHVHKILRFWGGGVFWIFGGGRGADFIFMGARIFLNFFFDTLAFLKRAFRHARVCF